MDDCLSWEAGTRLEGGVDAAMCERLAEQTEWDVARGGEAVTQDFRVKGNRPTGCQSGGQLPSLQIRRLRLSVGIVVCGTSSRLTLPTEAAT